MLFASFLDIAINFLSFFLFTVFSFKVLILLNQDHLSLDSVRQLEFFAHGLFLSIEFAKE